MLSRLKNDEKGFTLIELIMVIVILGIISAVAIPKFLSLSGSARTAAARGVGSAISSTITNKHAAYLIDGTTYTMADILDNTQFSGGISSTTGSTTTDGQISNVSATQYRLNYKTKLFLWTYNAQVNDTAPWITEAASNW